MTIDKHNGKAKTLLPHYVAEAVDSLLLYLRESEHVHYENCPLGKRYNHLFRQLKTVSRWLELCADQKGCVCEHCAPSLTKR